MDTPTLSLIIPAYNEEAYIASCLKEIGENGQGQFLEIIVIDNNSTDRTAEIARSFPGVRVYEEKEKGVTKARQRGFKESSGELLAFMDADCRMPKDWPAKIKKEFADESLACLSGPYIFYDASAFHNFFSKLYWWILGMPSYFFTGYMAMGGNLVLRRSVLEKMGGFDTSIAFFGDDTDTARRAKAFGKASFKLNFVMYSSSRRLKKQGVLSTLYAYISNFLSEVFFHRPTNSDSQKYEDFR